jgi:hypothetical protein
MLARSGSGQGGMPRKLMDAAPSGAKWELSAALQHAPNAAASAGLERARRRGRLDLGETAQRAIAALELAMAPERYPDDACSELRCRRSSRDRARLGLSEGGRRWPD